MKHLSFLIALFVASTVSSGNATAQEPVAAPSETAETSLPSSTFWAEVQNTSTGQGQTTSIQTMGMKFFTPHVGAWFWTQTTKSWGEGYAGPLFAITKELQLGVAGGFETNAPKSFWRVGYIVGYYSDDHYAEAFGEYGASGWWVRMHGNYQLNDWFGIGAHIETNLGGGPRFRLRFPPSKMPYTIELWGAPLVDFTGNGWIGTYFNGIVGIRIVM